MTSVQAAPTPQSKRSSQDYHCLQRILSQWKQCYCNSAKTPAWVANAFTAASEARSGGGRKRGEEDLVLMRASKGNKG